MSTQAIAFHAFLWHRLLAGDPTGEKPVPQEHEVAAWVRSHSTANCYRFLLATLFVLHIAGCGTTTPSKNRVGPGDLYRKPPGVETRWASFENPTAEKGRGGTGNKGAKGHPFDSMEPGETKTLIEADGSGTIRRIWLTLNPMDKKMLRSLRLDMYWDDAEKPAVSVPLGDFFGMSVGKMVAFDSALFSSPEARSFVCTIPMPFRSAARVTLTNESDRPVIYIFYDVAFTIGDQHAADAMYFHAHWRRERWTTLGRDFEILPKVQGEGRYLGCNIGVMVKPGHAGWWGEGEAKIYLDGDSELPTLVNSGLEDYIGTAWGLGAYAHSYQGCPVADKKAHHYAFYRYHILDPVYFDQDCRVTIQQMGGGSQTQILAMHDAGVDIQPVSVIDPKTFKNINLLDLESAPKIGDDDFPKGWTNYYRQDDFSATALFYLDSPTNNLPALAPLAERLEGLE